MNHHGDLRIVWFDDGEWTYAFEGNAWSGAIRDIFEKVMEDMEKSNSIPNSIPNHSLEDY